MATTRDKYILEIETEQANRGLRTTEGAVGGLIGRLGGLKTVAATALAGLGVASAVQGINSTIAGMDQLAKRAQAVDAIGNDVDFEGFQVASQVLEEMGLSTAEADRAFKNMTTRLQEAADTGKGPAADAFEKIRDSIVDANGNLVDMPTLFQEVTQALQDGTLTMTDARKILGDVVGPKILGGFERLAQGGTNAAEAFADAAANSNIVDREAAENAELFGDTMGRLANVAGRLGTEIVSYLLPHLNTLAEGALEKLPEIIDFVTQAFRDLAPVFDLVGEVMETLIIPALSLIFKALGEVASAITPLIELALPKLRDGFDKIAGAISFVIEKVTAVLDWFGKVITKAQEMGGAVRTAFSEMTGGVVAKAQDAWRGVTGWFGRMYDDVVGNSIVPDMSDGVLSVFDAMSGGMVSKVQDAIAGVSTAFGNVASAVGTKFEDITGISLDNVRQQVSSMSTTIYSAVSSLASDVGSRLSGLWSSVRDTASRVGDFFGGFEFSNPFAGFFANGGFIPKGQFGVVGERGPELVSGPAQVTPMDQMMGTQQVTYNINAVDASSFRSLLARDPGFVHAVVQRGQSIGGRR